jgi:hypothetical protein
MLFSTVLALAVAGGAGYALAQDKGDERPAQEPKKQETVPPATGRNLPEQAGTTEPSSKVQGTSKDENVFVNGVLSVQGAPTDGDTAPAKFSARTDKDDQVPIAGYRLKHLTGDQRTEIVQGLGSQRDAAPAANANAAYAIVGAEIPSTVALTGLTAMPEALTAKFPGLKGTAFMRAEGKVLVVDLDNSLVVGVLEG